jgi:hypothetical protein
LTQKKNCILNWRIIRETSGYEWKTNYSSIIRESYYTLPCIYWQQKENIQLVTKNRPHGFSCARAPPVGLVASSDSTRRNKWSHFSAQIWTIHFKSNCTKLIFWFCLSAILPWNASETIPASFYFTCTIALIASAINCFSFLIFFSASVRWGL